MRHPERGSRDLPSITRAKVARLRADGLTYAQIAQALGFTKSTVAYHARRLGKPADDRFAKRYDWSEVQRMHDDGISRRDCMRTFGFSRAAWGKAVKRGDLVPRQWVTPIEELLVAGRRRKRGHIKRRLIAAGLKENRCEECGTTEWRGEPLAMALHHVNGDPNDNRPENLRLLCPNCHSQTPNFAGRNRNRRLRLLDSGEPDTEEAA